MNARPRRQSKGVVTSKMPAKDGTPKASRAAQNQGWYARTYLQSSHWRQTRLEAIERAHHRCERCRRTPDLFHVHHVSYARLWGELPGDLEVLCADCHNRLHGGRGRRGHRSRQNGLVPKDRVSVTLALDRVPRSTADIAVLSGISEQRAGRALRSLRRQGRVKLLESRGMWLEPPS